MSPFTFFQAERLAAMTFRFRADKFVSQIQQNTLSNTRSPTCRKGKRVAGGTARWGAALPGLQTRVGNHQTFAKVGPRASNVCIQMANDLAAIQSRLCELDDISRGEMDMIARCAGLQCR